MADLVEKLKNIGFNSYEAKVYLALLKKHPATGYELAKLANIPQSRVYDTLKVLEVKNIISQVNSEPATYTPLKPKTLLASYQKKFESDINFLEKHLPTLEEDYTEPIITIVGKEKIYDKIHEVIRNAKKEIYIESWSQDFKEFEQDLLDAYNRNVEIRIVGYDNFSPRFGLVFQHAFARDIEFSLGGRMFAMVCDDKEGIFGKISSTTNDSKEVSAIWSQNKTIALIIKEFVVHDMYLIDVEENLIEQMKYVYGKGFKKLKDKVLGNNPSYLIH